MRCVQIAIVKPVAVFVVHLSGDLGELIPLRHVLEYNVLASLLKQILRDEYYADVPLLIVLVKSSQPFLE